MEIKNMNEYNPEWSKDGTLNWKKIGEKTGKKGIRKQKQYNHMDIDKIIVPNGMEIDGAVLEASRKQYKKTHIMIPVFLSYGFVLIAGYEQYVLAQELGLNKIAFQRVTKMTQRETKEFREMICHRAIGNKKHPVKDIDGNKIYVTYAQRKELYTCYRLAKKYNLRVDVTPCLKINIYDAKGNVCKKDATLKIAHNYLKNYKKNKNRKEK